MSELDLTLLTDEERDIWEHTNNRHMSAQRSKYFIGQVLTALIAARAENKRLMILLHDTDALLDGMSIAGVGNWLLPGNREVYANLHMRIRGLLQSEKEGE